MSLIRIGNTSLRVGNRLFRFDNSINASIGTISNTDSYFASNFNLYVPVFNSGFSNSFYVCASCSTNSEYAVTGSTQIINQGSTYQWTLVDKFNNPGSKTIKVDLYCNNIFLSTKNYTMTPLNYAEGGTQYVVGNSVIHVITSSTNFVVNNIPNGNIEVLMSGGGGGAANGENDIWSYMDVCPGAGGAGGTLYGTITGVTSGTYPVVVGLGGTVGVTTKDLVNYGKGNNGGNTTFKGYTAYGGGGGGRDGGSGGGGGFYYWWVSKPFTTGGTIYTPGNATQTNQGSLTAYKSNGIAYNNSGVGGGGGGGCNYSYGTYTFGQFFSSTILGDAYGTTYYDCFFAVGGETAAPINGKREIYTYSSLPDPHRQQRINVYDIGSGGDMPNQQIAYAGNNGGVIIKYTY